MTDPIARIIDMLVSNKGFFVIAEDETIRLLKIQATTIRDQNFFIELTKIASQKESNGDNLSIQERRHLALVLTEYTRIEKLISKIQRQNRNLIVIKPIVMTSSLLAATIVIFQAANSSSRIAALFPQAIFSSSFMSQGYAFATLVLVAILAIILAIIFKTIGGLAKHRLQGLMLDYNSTIAIQEIGESIEQPTISAKRETTNKLSSLKRKIAKVKKDDPATP